MADWYPLPGSLRGPKGDKGDQGDAGADGGTSLHAARHAVGGSDPVTPASLGAAPASHTHAAADITRTILGQTSVGTGGTIAPAATADIDRFTSTGSSATLAVPSDTPADGAVVNVEVYSTGSTTALTLAGGYTLTGGQGSPVPVPVGRVAYLALRYRALTPAGWRILAVSVDN